MGIVIRNCRWMDSDGGKDIMEKGAVRWKSNTGEAIERRDTCMADGVCNTKAGENYLTCSEDCATGMKDNLCDFAEDGICDEDCEKEADKDCAVPEKAWIRVLGRIQV